MTVTKKLRHDVANGRTDRRTDAIHPKFLDGQAEKMYGLFIERASQKLLSTSSALHELVSVFVTDFLRCFIIHKWVFTKVGSISLAS